MRNPCENCTSKQEDIYGLLCDLSCGKHSMYVNYQSGIKEVVDWVNANIYEMALGGENSCVQSLFSMKTWKTKLKEWGIYER